MTTVPLIITKDDPVTGTPTDVHVGSKVNSIFIRIETIHNSGEWVTIPRVYMIIMKNPANDLAIPYPASIGQSDKRKFVIHQEMLMQTGINADANSFPRTMFLGVVKIPKGYQRNGIQDRLSAIFALDVAETTATVSVCVQCIYKEYF